MTAVCIGCDDLHACEGGCYWLRVDYIRCVGVCSACQPYAAAWDAAHAFGPPHLDLVAHLHRQREFSERTFGPGARPGMNVAHIRKELIEIEGNPGDLMEWIDVVLLAFDGALRAGHEPAAIALALATKLTRNELRSWPDWRTVAPDTAIEHVREVQAPSLAYGQMIAAPENELMFELRVAGPDDVVTYDDELVALRNANRINKQYLADRAANPEQEVLCVATVHHAAEVEPQA